MKLGVLSDSHGYLGHARQAMEMMGEIDGLIHCGDHYRDALTLSGEYNVPVYGVRGNCDPGAQEVDEKVIDFMGLTILITHGHRHRVKFSLDTLYSHALGLRVQAVVFGHTHIPLKSQKEGVLFFNSGSISYPRGNGGPSYGVLQVSQGIIVPSLHYLD